MPTLAITIPEPTIHDGVECCNPDCKFYEPRCRIAGKQLDVIFIDPPEGETNEPLGVHFLRIRPDECRDAEQLHCEILSELQNHVLRY